MQYVVKSYAISDTLGVLSEAIKTMQQTVVRTLSSSIFDES